MLQLPITVAEVMEGLVEAFAKPENAVQERSTPRASGLSGCARQQAYDMAGIQHATDWGRNEMAFTQEQGRIAEDLTIAGIEQSGTVRVVNRQIELPEDSGYTGHPDGELVFKLQAWESTDANGLNWGFEHKHLGQYKYQQIQKRGLLEGAPDYIIQTVAYGMALGWDACLVAITAQDASVIRREMTRNLNAKNPKVRWAENLDPANANPKMILFPLDLRELYPSMGMRIKLRADQLTAALGPELIGREGDPTANPPGFPCSYCGHFDQCLRDGGGGVPIMTVITEDR